MNRFRVCLIAVLLISAAIVGACADETTSQIVYPVNTGMASEGVRQQFKELTELFEKFVPPADPGKRAECKADLLRKLPNTDMFIYILDSSKAMELGLVAIEGKDSQKYSLIIQEFSMYRNEVNQKTNKPFRIGIGVRLFILVKERTAKVNTLSIPAIAAKAEAKELEATIRLEVIGISGKAIVEATPMPAELTFTTLMEMYKSIDTIKTAIWAEDEDTYLTPQILACAL